MSNQDAKQPKHPLEYYAASCIMTLTDYRIELEQEMEHIDEMLAYFEGVSDYYYEEVFETKDMAKEVEKRTGLKRPPFPESPLTEQKEEAEVVEPFDSPYAQAVIKVRWPKGVTCPCCNSQNIGMVSTRTCYLFQCKTCHLQFTPTGDTILHRHHLPLSVYGHATALLLENPKLSKSELHRRIKVKQYRTAWTMYGKLRKALSDSNTEDYKILNALAETYILDSAKKVRGKHDKGND